jgi:hypothetical protein
MHGWDADERLFRLIDSTIFAAGDWAPHRQMVRSHCSYTVPTLLLHCCYIVATLSSHCCYTVVTQLLHCCYTAATP